MRVLLVNPEFPKTYWGFNYALRIVGKRSAYPPLGLLTVSALLPPDWEKRLIDLNVNRGLQAKDIKWADMVFVTGMLIQKDSFHRVVNECKAGGKRVVVGGSYVSTSMQEVPKADHIFVGEAEATLPEFVADLNVNRAKAVYKAAERPLLPTSPIPDYGLVDMRKYNTMSVQYARGCPFNCEFCDIIEIYGRVPRTKDDDQVLAELEVLRKSGWKGTVFFVDDNFIGNKPKVKRLLPKLIEWQEKHGFPFTFLTQASVNLADDTDLLRAMQLAGFHRVFIGIETPVEASLNETQKLQNTQKSLKRNLLDSVREIQSYGMEVMAGFIVGFDNDPDDVFDLQIEFIRESAIPLAMVGTLTALPDTQLWRRLRNEGRLISESDGNNVVGEGEFNFVPVMDAKKLIAGYRRIVKTVYRSSEFYARVLDCLQRLPPPLRPEPKIRSLVGNLAVSVRIAARLGTIDPDRTEFWKFARQAFWQHRDRFVQAMSLAVMGYHCRELTES